VKEYSAGLMDQNTKVNSLKITFMVKGNINGLMAENM